MDRTARAQIESLLYEVRHFPERAPWDVEALARRFHQDPLVVRALLETERVELMQDTSEQGADTNDVTQVMSHKDLGLG